MERNLVEELENQLDADTKKSEEHLRKEEDEILDKMQEEIDELKDAQKISQNKIF